MASSKDDGAVLDASDVAAYVASLARELKELADGHELKPLGYLLDLVRLEAEQCIRDLPLRRGS